MLVAYFQVIFEAGVGKDFQSDIAIDTIHFEDPPGSYIRKFIYIKVFKSN